MVGGREVGLSAAIRHRLGGGERQLAVGHFGAGHLSSAAFLRGRVATGVGCGAAQAGTGERGVRAGPPAWGPRRAVPHLSAQHTCAEAAVREARAAPLWRRNSPPR